MQKIKLRTEESGKKLSAAYAPPKWSETAEEEELSSYDPDQIQVLVVSTQNFFLGGVCFLSVLYNKTYWVLILDIKLKNGNTTT